MQASDQRKAGSQKRHVRAHAHTHRQREPQLLWRHLSRRERRAMAGNSHTSFISASESRVHTDIARLHLVFFVLLHARTLTYTRKPTLSLYAFHVCIMKLQIYGVPTQPYAFPSAWLAHITYARGFSGTVTQKTQPARLGPASQLVCWLAGVLQGGCCPLGLQTDRQTGGS